MIIFPDGKRVVATASAASPEEEVPVVYRGPMERLGSGCEKGALWYVEWFLRSRARNLEARFEIKNAGDYDRWGWEGVLTMPRRSGPSKQPGF